MSNCNFPLFTLHCVSVEECERRCPDLIRKICRLPSDSGPCEAAIPKYFYNSITKKCEQFIYGGCLGNENRFATLAECEQVCSLY
ncbi:hypothetical protein EB796_019567 [Bugula neritina]|uniref:BPTI/Kunitz inhibitor domain-containing protein n=1 Tax=Bugula neritina TaxID=10212 RepID=A0A7J7J7Y5_BUGNE|nr:hypothetical protein EB796_019567 [Bugula neritina]